MTILSRPTFAGKDPEAEQHTRQFLETLRHQQIQHGSELLEDGAVTTAKLAADAVTEPKIADDAVTAAQILAGAVGTAELADLAVTVGKLALVPWCHIRRTTNHSHTSSGNWQRVTFDSEVEDSDTMFTASATIATIKTAGVFHIEFCAAVASNATGQRAIAICSGNVSGAGFKRIQDSGAASGNAEPIMTVSYEGRWAVNDTVSFQLFQDSGGTLAFEAADYSLQATLRWVRA